MVFFKFSQINIFLSCLVTVWKRFNFLTYVVITNIIVFVSSLYVFPFFVQENDQTLTDCKIVENNGCTCFSVEDKLKAGKTTMENLKEVRRKYRNRNEGKYKEIDRISEPKDQRSKRTVATKWMELDWLDTIELDTFNLHKAIKGITERRNWAGSNSNTGQS